MSQSSLRSYFLRRLPLAGFILVFSAGFLWLVSGVGRPAQAASATLVISEVYYDAVGIEPDGEWIELYNLSASSINLAPYKVGDEETRGGGEGMYQFPAGATAGPGQVLVVANKATVFLSTYGFNPTYELVNSSAAVPDMVKYSSWATGSLSLSNSSDEVLLLDGADAQTDAMSWVSTFAFNPAAPDVAEGHSLERSPATQDTDSAADWLNQATPAPGQVTAPPPTPTPTPTPIPGCGKTGAYLATWDIQGAGHTSPYAGQTVTNVRGIVTANFQQGTGGPAPLNGFFIQAHESDCNPVTSDGLWVFTSNTPKAINVGALVQLNNATVSEYQGPNSFIWELTLTELECRSGCSVTTLQANPGQPPVEEYDPPADPIAAAAYAEAREGMLVQVSVDSTVVAAVNAFNEFYMLRGLGQDRIHQAGVDQGRLIVVDGDGVAAARCGQDGLGYIKTFDTIHYAPANGYAVYGPLNYGFNTYRVQQDDDRACIGFAAGDDSSYDPADNPPPTADANILTVASLNALDLFDTVDDPYKADDVLTPAEYAHNSLKRAAAICDPMGLNRPNLIALQEVENDTVLQKLVGDIAANCGVTYNFYTLAGPDNRSIEVAYLTRSDRVTVLAVNDRQACSAKNWGVTYEPGDHPADVVCSGSTPYYLFNRPPLEMTAQVTLNGAVRTFHVINNHFKSKLTDAACATADCTDWRVEQAQFVDSLVDGILSAESNAAIIVLGDLNDFDNSAPLDILDKTSGVLTNTWDDLPGPPSTGQGSIRRYAYIHNGVSQVLDHILISDALNTVPRLFSPRHINADWPGTHAADNSMYGSSDHDFLVAGFDFTPLTLHVGDLDGIATQQGSKWQATVTITVLNAREQPVAAATVSGNWSGGFVGPASCVTTANGTCQVVTGLLGPRKAKAKWSVTNITYAGLTYDPAANHDPDGDSNGTSIIVLKP